MKIKLILIILISIVFSNCNSSPMSKITEYKYKFYVGATGNQKTIEYNEDEIPLVFNSKSNQEAVKTLSALKWNVLYPNSNKRIILYGIFDDATKELILYHWYLPSPFIYQTIEDITELPHQFIEKEKDKLDSTDFDIEISNPEQYNKKDFTIK